MFQKNVIRDLTEHTLLSLLLIIVFFAIFFVLESVGIDVFTLLPALFQQWELLWGVGAVIGFLLLYVIFGIAFLPQIPLVFLAGMTFGLFEGVVFSLVGEALSASVNYLLGKEFSLRDTFHEHVKKHGAHLVFVSKLLGVKSEITSYAAGKHKLPFKPFLLALLGGFLPYAFVYSLAGSQLETLRALSLWSVLVLKIVVVGVFVFSTRIDS